MRCCTNHAQGVSGLCYPLVFRPDQPFTVTLVPGGMMERLMKYPAYCAKAFVLKRAEIRAHPKIRCLCLFAQIRHFFESIYCYFFDGFTSNQAGKFENIDIKAKNRKFWASRTLESKLPLIKSVIFCEVYPGCSRCSITLIDAILIQASALEV